MERIALVTGFEPFGKYSSNPTKAVARELNGSRLNCGLTIHGEVLPSSYTKAPQWTIGLIEKLQPEVILSLGYASRVPRIRIETCGHNEKSSEYSDSDGVRFSGVPIEPDGPESVSTSANSLAILRAIKLAGIDAELSSDAERFVCNCLIYRIAGLGLDIPFCYIHTPTPELFSDLILGQPEKITIPYEYLLRAVIIAIETMSKK